MFYSNIACITYMAAVTIFPPSPLHTSPHVLQQSAAAPPTPDNRRSNAKQRQPAKTKAQPAAPLPAGVTKPKQSKSRNGKLHFKAASDNLSHEVSSDLISNWSLTQHSGCVTCKEKRLKCDESKPTCDHCRRRGVPCGGYKKDFKWKTFDGDDFTSSKPPAPPRRRRREFTWRVEGKSAD